MGEDEVSTTRPRQGSFLSTRQIAWSVYKGQQVIFTTPTGGQVQGYVFGQDDYHWAVVRQDTSVVLVHKSCPVVTIVSRPTYREEHNLDDLEGFVAPFRRHVCELLNRPDPMTASIQKAG